MQLRPNAKNPRDLDIDIQYTSSGEGSSNGLVKLEYHMSVSQLFSDVQKADQMCLSGLELVHRGNSSCVRVSYHDECKATCQNAGLLFACRCFFCIGRSLSAAGRVRVAL